MLEVIAWVGGITGYLTVAGGVYRKQYVRTFREWRKWQADDPHRDEQLWDDYHSYTRPRAKVGYRTYTAWKSDRIAPWYLAPLWLPIGIYLGLRKVLQPEVEVPDYIKIKELEKLSDD